MICLKFDASRDERVANKFDVSGFPTFVMLLPDGETVYKGSGKPPGKHFVSMFTYKRHNAMVNAYNAKKWADLARHAYFIRRWFKGSEAAKVATEIVEGLKTEQAFVAAYKKVEEESKKQLAELEKKARAEIEAAERKRKVAALKAEAGRWYGTRGKRHKSYPIYKKIIWEYPKSPEADDARKLLRKRGYRWKEPPPPK